MSTKRTPIQIILIEQLFYSLVFLIGLVLFRKYGFIVIVNLSELSSETKAYVLIGSFIIPLFLWFYAWLPYTSVRIWRSASSRPKGAMQFAFKAYSGLLLATLVVSGLGALTVLPEIIGQLKM